MNKKEQGFTLWFTGLSGSGKSTLADALVPKLEKRGLRVQRLDGDIIRESLTKDLGFSKEDRDTNIERVTFVAKLLTKHGVAVLATFISPYRQRRKKTRQEIGNFVEVYCKCSLKECIKRDPRGNYKKALNGQIKNYTGIDDPYEEPENPEIVIETDKKSVEECIKEILEYLEKHAIIRA